MHWGSPEFVLVIIGMAMLAGVLKSWGRPRRADKNAGKEIAAFADQNSKLRVENERLRDRIDLHEDRLITLERIVTDSGYDIAHQIERLREPSSRLETGRDRTRS